MSRLFEGEDLSSDESDNLKTNNQYAKQYDTWRKKEELNKLKTKYGEDVLDEDESSSSSDDEEGLEITEEVEKDFFKTLSCLKNRDPAIYERDVVFFKNTPYEQVKKKKKEKPVFLKDYERNLILEKGGVLSDDEDVGGSRSPTYNQEQQQIKESFKTVLDSDEENDNSLGGILQKRKKTEEEVQKEESDYKKWLAGQKSTIKDEKIQNDLKPLKEYWNNPSLDEEERFLRDYLLNKKYLDNENEDYIPTYEEVVHDSDQDLSNDEENLDKQEEFEHKYNFRYEEPDQEFIKRYPRTMENSLRKTDGRRKEKRQEIKERKKKEKEEKMQELKKMQEFKRKEIEEKLEKLKEITGNENLGFDDQDIDGEFDPEEHDRKMQALFNDQFYEAPEDDQKPEFPDLDKELEIENWERFTGNPSEDYDPHCEDEDFNMDCDYDPQVTVSNDNDDKSKQKRRKKSKFAKAVSMPKPKFDPTDKKFEKYFEEYYKLDCEDIIGDIPCRFKYRKVIPNDFGLTTEEILLANERELNKWCSLKKAVQIRSDEVERYEQIAYQRKGQNLNLKQKILPSLFTKTSEEETDKSSRQEDNVEKNQGDSLTKNNVKQKHISKNFEIPEDNVIGTNKTNKKQKMKITNVGGRDCQTELETKKGTNEGDSLKKNDVKEKHNSISKNLNLEMPEDNVIKNNKTNKRIKKKTENVEVKDSQTELETNTSEKNGISQNNLSKVNKKKKKKKKSNASNTQISVDTVNNSEDINNKKRKRKDTDTISKKKKFHRNKEEKLSISDARLSAYGINPKKFKNKIKYKKFEAKK